MPTIYTVGHSTRSTGDLVALLRDAGALAVADVRRWPVSSRYPHFDAKALAPALAGAGIAYHHFASLDGYRQGGYERHMETVEFREGLHTLQRLGAGRPLAVL